MTLRWFAFIALLITCTLGRAHAQGTRANLELSFTPTHRTQLAVWIERDDGMFMGSYALTHGVAVAGIGNRPGALQMNSGFRWPYGRREGVLPVWAHRRLEGPGAQPFRRVIFQNRNSEGFASRTSDDHSVDDYYCLSFDQSSTGRDALDAVTCASVFSSDKGRFINEADVQANYGEPYETGGVGSSRPLPLHSLYPPRRDVSRCTAPGCYDHQDVDQFAAHAREVMPELDAVTRATPQGERRVDWLFALPEDWSAEHEYVLYIEANVEGDYNEHWNDAAYPTPKRPAEAWDTWATGYGYPYRGQPSVVYALPFTLDQTTTVSTSKPVGYGALEGEDGEVRPLDETISDDPVGKPGSGADRLRESDGVRATLRVTSSDPCAGANPPPSCGVRCTPGSDDCGSELFCQPSTGTCGSYCAATAAPEGVQELRVEPYPDELRAHMWARMSFRAASSERPIGTYEVRVKPEGGDWSEAFTHDSDQELLSVALDVCSDPENGAQNRCRDMRPGTMIEVDLAGLKQSTRYSVSVTPRDANCGARGETRIVDFHTAERAFTTVSPCFVATATFGSPLASQVSVLRRVRDRYLAPHAAGRMLIDAYYEHGPRMAAAVREHAWLRTVSRVVLTPVVMLARWWVD